MTMKLNKSGLDLIKSYEGLRLKAYKVLESEKYYTIGYGHYGSDVRFGDTITKNEADNLFKKDVKRFEDAVNKYVKVELTQNQFNALVSFTYNVGVGALQTSTLLNYLNKGDFKKASNEFDKWIHSGGKVLAGLVARRKKEKSLFLKDVKTSSKSPSQTVSKPTSKTYTVKSGDTLSEIAQDNKTTVSKLMKLNPSIKDADKIYSGQKIKLN